MNGKRTFCLLVIVAGLLLTGFVVTNVLAGPAAVAGDEKEKVMTILVDPAVITINAGVDVFEPGAGASFFLTVGTIIEVNGKPASGIYYCRGVFTGGPVGDPLPPLHDGTPEVVDGLTFVDQYFLIDGQGTILVTGDEDPGAPSMVVTGGTGRFRGVEGTKTQVGLPTPVGSGDMFHTFKINRTPDDDDDDDDD